MGGGTAIHKQLFEYNNKHFLLSIDRLVEWLEQSPNIQAAGIRIHEKGQLFLFIIFLSFLSFFNW